MQSPISKAEALKYSEVWAVKDYGKFSPGAELVDYFLDIADEDSPSLRSVVDIGCGAGAASRKLKDLGFQVIGFDLTDKAWAHDDIPLRTGCIWHGLDVPGLHDYGYCCDVMEHIPTEYTALAIKNMLSKCANVFLNISFLPDHFGPAILGRPLHLTVRPFEWWRDMLSEVSVVREARDLIGQGVFYVSKQ